MPTPGDTNFDETILFVCDALGLEPVTVGDWKPTPESQVRDLYYDIKHHLHEIDFKETNQHFYYQDNRPLYRGLNPHLWLSKDVGMLWPEDLKKLIKKHGSDAFKRAGITAWKNVGYDWLTHGVVVMRHSENGAACGIGVRRYEEFVQNVGNVKYAKDSGANPLVDTSAYLYGYRDAKQSDSAVVYVVEGEFDALALMLRGFGPVVATGSGQITPGQYDRLVELNKRIVMITDADDAGFDNACQLAEKHPALHFMLLDEGEDPDTFAQNYGVDPLRTMDRFTALEMEMMGSPLWDEDADAATEHFLLKIVDRPSSYNELEIKTLADISQAEEDYLRSVMFYERDMTKLTQLYERNRIS